MEKILITGGAGYIGSVTSHLLTSKGYKIIVIDSLENGYKENIPDEAQFINENISNADKINEILRNNKIEAVIHFAGYIQAGESMLYPEKYFKNNLENGKIFLKVLKKNNISKVIFSSSAAVYGNPKKIPIIENHELNPINNYGKTKLLFERELEKSKMNFISLRYFNAAGSAYNLAENHKPETHLIPNILNVALKLKPYVEVYGNNYNTKDGTCIRDYIHVKDLAKAHLSALEKMDKLKNNSYNLGNNTGHSVKEVIEKCKKITQSDIPLKILPRREGDPTVLTASNKKAKKELKWFPEYELKDIIKSAWQTSKNNLNTNVV